jgi:hypothetical protein
LDNTMTDYETTGGETSGSSILNMINNFSPLVTENQFDDDDIEGDLENKIGLYIITPTYPRPEQLPELTRLSQTLMVIITFFLL